MLIVEATGLTGRLERLKRNTIILMADERKNVWVNDIFDAVIKNTNETQKREIIATLSKSYKEIMDGRRFWNKKKKKPVNKRK